MLTVIGLVEKEHHDPLLFRKVPENPGIAVPLGNILEYRIVLIFRPGAATVIAESNALHKVIFILTGRMDVSKYSDDRFLVAYLETRCVVTIDNGGARPNCIFVWFIW